MDEEKRADDLALGQSLYEGYYQRPEVVNSTCRICGGLLTKKKRRDFLPLGLVIVCITSVLFFVTYPLINLASIVIFVYAIPGFVLIAVSPNATKTSCAKCRERRKRRRT